MDAETLAIGGRHSADRPVKRRRPRPGRPFDKRTRTGRRTAELAVHFRARLGVADAGDPLLLAQIEHAARLVALSEAASARALRADPDISLDDVVRLQRLADQSVRRLRLDRHKPPSAPGLADYLDYLRTQSNGSAA